MVAFASSPVPDTIISEDVFALIKLKRSALVRIAEETIEGLYEALCVCVSCLKDLFNCGRAKEETQFSLDLEEGEEGTIVRHTFCCRFNSNGTAVLRLAV